MRTLVIALFFFAPGCIMDDGAIENTCDERPGGCEGVQGDDTGDTGAD